MTTKETKLIKLDLRLRELVEANTHKTRRNLELQELTEIPAPLWANWWAGRARPSSEMLMEICTKWPEYTLWLMTGATDILAGQIAPNTPSDQQQKPTTRYLRHLTEIMDLKNPEVGYSLTEYEVDELNALSDLRKREIERRLQTASNSNATTYGDELHNEQKIEQLLQKLEKGWTFHESLYAQLIALEMRVGRAHPSLQALCVGITAFQRKISIEEAFIVERNKLAERPNSEQELLALENARELLKLNEFKNN